MIKRILLGLSGTSQSAATVQYAIELAKSCQASITVVAIVDIDRLSNVGPVPVGGGSAADDLRQHRIDSARESVEIACAAFKTECDAAGVEHSLHRIEGDPVALVTSFARHHDIVVVGLKTAFNFEQDEDAAYTPTELLNPLISGGVRPILAVTGDYRPFRKALIAYSGSMESATTMRSFVQAKAWPDMQIRIVSVMANAADADPLLEEASSYCKLHGFEVETQHLTGDKSKAIQQESEGWDADLIVMGNSGKNVILRRIFGETALHLMTHSTRSLFLSQ